MPGQIHGGCAWSLPGRSSLGTSVSEVGEDSFSHFVCERHDATCQGFYRVIQVLVRVAKQPDKALSC